MCIITSSPKIHSNSCSKNQPYAVGVCEFHSHIHSVLKEQILGSHWHSLFFVIQFYVSIMFETKASKACGNKALFG